MRNKSKHDVSHISHLNSQDQLANRTEKILIDIRELSAITGLKIGSLYHFTSEHRIPVVRISARCIRFELNAIREWIASLSEPADPMTEKGGSKDEGDAA